MSFSRLANKRRAVGLAATCALTLGGLATTTVAGAGPADAAACPVSTAGGTLNPISVASPCTLAGTGTTAGALTMDMYTDTLAWSSVLAGTSGVDTTAADQGFSVDDETAGTAGWNVNASYNGFFTNVGYTTAAKYPIGLSVNGDTTSFATTTAPTAACSGGTGTCVLPDNNVGPYPVALSGTPTAIYNNLANTTPTGTGPTDIGNVGGSITTGPGAVGWWITVPSNEPAGTYYTQVTVAVDSGPTI